MASELRVNTINSRTGFGTITVSETGQDLVGITTIENLTTENTLVGAAASFTGNVQIGGVLTYEDVTNVDSVGLITARDGINVIGAGVSIRAGGLNVNSGVSTFTGAVTANSTLYVGDDLTIVDKIVHNGDTDTAIRFSGADTITAETGGSERLRIDSSGHLGLGISPSDIDSIGRSLNIASSTGGAIYLQDTDSPTTKFAAISYSGGTAALQIHAHHSASYIDLGTNGTERVRITNDGKVGINDSSPANQLIVKAPGGSGHSCAKVVSGDGNQLLTMQVIQGAEARLGTDSGAPLALYSNGNEYARMQTTGELTFGTTADVAPDGFASKIQVNSSNHTGSIQIGRHTANANGPALLFNKTRSGSATPGNGAVSNDDNLGTIRWYGSDGTDYNSAAAQIACYVDATPGTNDLPGRIEMGTTPDGESSPKVSFRLSYQNSLVIAAGGVTTSAMDSLSTTYPHMPSWTQGSNNIAGDVWTTVLNVGTSEATWDLVSFEGSTNFGLWAEVTCYFSQITAGKAGRQRVSYRMMRTGNSNFGTSVDGPYDKVGTDTNDHFTPSITTTGSGSGMRAKLRITTTSLVNYCMTLYHIRWTSGDYGVAPIIIV